MGKKQEDKADREAIARAKKEGGYIPLKDVIDEIGKQDEDKPKIIVQSTPVPRTRTFVAKPCTSCKALREAAGDKKNYTRVFATRGRIRYCRCDYCRNTWKDSE